MRSVAAGRFWSVIASDVARVLLFANPVVWCKYVNFVEGRKASNKCPAELSTATWPQGAWTRGELRRCDSRHWRKLKRKKKRENVGLQFGLDTNWAVFFVPLTTRFLSACHPQGRATRYTELTPNQPLLGRICCFIPCPSKHETCFVNVRTSLCN
jgi:hypothetical protein